MLVIDSVGSDLFWNCVRLQVMKMVMALTVQESGCVHYVKRPGAVLDSGCIVAKLELDDSTSLHPVSAQLHQLKKRKKKLCSTC